MGFGPSVPSPSWGGLIAAASQHVYDDPWLMVPTGVVLALTVIAANVLADTVRRTGGGERGRARAGRRRRPGKRRRRGRRHRSSAGRRNGPVPAAAVRGRGRAADADPDALLDVRDLTVSVAGGPGLVTGVSFALRPGTVLGLVGESGCGKTMTARALPGLLPDGVAGDRRVAVVRRP